MRPTGIAQHWAKDVTELVGKTPLVQLQRIVPDLPATLLAKLEMFSPGGSLKDRVALQMICDAENQGLLRAGHSIIEPTSGNMGISLAWIAAARGYTCILTLPNTWFPQQFYNQANPKAHREGTALEIWQDTGGAVDMVIIGVGTGGTLTGLAEALRARKPSLQVIAVEPASCAILSGGRPGPHRIEGLGAGFQPDTLRVDLIDRVIPVTDHDAVTTAIHLLEREGLSVGISSGAVAWASLQEARKEENRGKVIVTVFPSAAERYLQTILFDDLRNHL